MVHRSVALRDQTMVVDSAALKVVPKGCCWVASRVEKTVAVTADILQEINMILRIYSFKCRKLSITSTTSHVADVFT